MKVNDSTSQSSFPPVSPRALDARKTEASESASALQATQTATSDTQASDGKKVLPNGKSLPANAAAAQSAQPADKDTGLANAIEQLQKNSAKNPQASGLLRALENLTERQGSASTIDTEA